ncbi:MAG TPA: AAA family ATPase [Clostridia bacterium]|nr:AAA family ATPase [Clostridia bacterium]
MYRQRWLTERLAQAGRVSRVLVLTGARQTGKSTLLANEPMFSGYHHVTLDDMATLTQAEEEPELLVNMAPNMVIDEAQRAPKLMIAVKKAVDDHPERRFVLSGSANLLLMKHVSESLAGRATYHVLYPPTCSEWRGDAAPRWLLDMFSGRLPEAGTESAPQDLPSTLLTGFMPAIQGASPSDAAYFWEGYVRTYLERDLRELSQVASVVDFRRVMQLAAMRTASLVSQSDIAKDSGVSQPTVWRYLNLLEMSHLYGRLLPAPVTSLKAVTKTPKGYVADTGLAAALAGYQTTASLDETFTGHLLESAVFMALQAISELWMAHLSFFRSGDPPHREVDFVVERDRKRLAVEVKMSHNVSYADARTIAWLMHEDTQCVGGVVIYAGEDVRVLAQHIIAVPWTML